MQRVKLFFIASTATSLMLLMLVIDALYPKTKPAVYATTLTGVPYTTDTLYLRYGGLNGYFSGHYQYPGAYVMQNESFVYAIKEKMR
jgi:hypothetical protein